MCLVADVALVVEALFDDASANERGKSVSLIVKTTTDDTFIPDVHVRVAIIRLLGPHADTVVLLLDDAEGAADVVVVLAEGFADQRQQLKRVRRRKGR